MDSPVRSASTGSGCGGRRLTARLAGCGVTVLRNESRSVEGLTVAGVDDLWAGRCRPEEALAGLDPARPAEPAGLLAGGYTGPMTAPRTAALLWSGGKDSALALHHARAA